MDDTSRSDTTATPTAPTLEKGGRGMLWGLLAVVLAFGAGFFWQFYEASTVRQDLSVAEQQLEMERLRVHLGQAALAAQAGNFELSRRKMSTFFGQLQEKAAAMPPEVRTVATDFLAMRDDVITGLSRSNPEYGAVLYGMHDDLSTAIDVALGTGTGGAPGESDGVGAPGEGTELDAVPDNQVDGATGR